MQTISDRSNRFPLGSRVTIDALAGDPYPPFHELRAAEPVTWAPELGMWLPTRRDDVVRVLADWERFTTDSPASTIRDIFGSHMLTTDARRRSVTSGTSSGRSGGGGWRRICRGLSARCSTS